MSRWKVEAEWSTVRRAVLWWEAYDSEFKDYKTFPTHAEALAYADKRARTREVVLPRVNGTTFIDENDLDIMVVSIANGIGIVQPSFDKPDEMDTIGIYPEIVEEVALALLAHAERMSE